MVPFGRTAAIFDVDDSLLDGNAGTIFSWYLYSEKIMLPEIRARIPRLVYEFARRRLGEKDMVELGSRCQAGLWVDDIRTHAQTCFERHLKKRITEGAVRQIRKHLLSGHYMLIASGSPQYIVDEVARHLRVHGAIGTRTRAVDGKATATSCPHRVPGREAGGRGRRPRHAGDPALRSWLYSDSSADVPLFEAVGHPVVVNPKEAFRVQAEGRGWQVVRWKDRTQEAQADVASEWTSWNG